VEYTCPENWDRQTGGIYVARELAQGQAGGIHVPRALGKTGWWNIRAQRTGTGRLLEYTGPENCNRGKLVEYTCPENWERGRLVEYTCPENWERGRLVEYTYPENWIFKAGRGTQGGLAAYRETWQTASS
jgi:hypothetical protein